MREGDARYTSPVTPCAARDAEHGAVGPEGVEPSPPRLRVECACRYATDRERLVPQDEHFLAILEKQATTAREGVAAFKDERDVAAAGVNMQAWEHKGDKLVHELEESLAKTFVTPIDREDIHLLSSALDDILDLANGAARDCQLFRVTERTPAMQELRASLHQGT